MKVKKHIGSIPLGNIIKILLHPYLMKIKNSSFFISKKPPVSETPEFSYFPKYDDVKSGKYKK